MSQVDNAIIGREAVLNAMQREVSDEGAIEIGADIARMGDDRTVLTKRKGLKLIETKSYTKLRTTEVCDKIEAFAGYDKSVLIKVDDTGVGGGVTDELMVRKYNVMAINFGSKPGDPDKYPNLISEAWFYLASIIDSIQLHMDSDLLMELSNRLWKMDNKGRRGVEGKDDYKKRGYRSPDLADSLILFRGSEGNARRGRGVWSGAGSRRLSGGAGYGLPTQAPFHSVSSSGSGGRAGPASCDPLQFLEPQQIVEVDSPPCDCPMMRRNRSASAGRCRAWACASCGGRFN